jgi:hypothetical protein
MAYLQFAWGLADLDLTLATGLDLVNSMYFSLHSEQQALSETAKKSN